MLELGNVTLWSCVWTPHDAIVDRIFRVVRYCTKVAKFGDVVFFSCMETGIQPDCGWRIVRIQRLNMNGWNLFVNREVPKHINTKFCMSVHEDGFIIDESLWSDEFLQYDYIGAPWPNGIVGNQGFCIESNRLLGQKRHLPSRPGDGEIPSDEFICVTHRQRLERSGIRFAPQHVAERFSTEMYGDEKPSFGFHGRNQAHRKYAEGWAKIAESEQLHGLST